MTNAWITASFPREGDEAPPGLPHHVLTEPTGVVVRNNQPNGDGAAPDQWVAVGPSAILHGSGFGHPTANGRVRAVQAADGGLRAYVGSGLGGVWYTDDGGATWLGLDIFSTTSDLSGSLFEADALAIGAIAVQFDPNGDVAQDLVFVGTGERRPVPDHLVDRIAGIGIRQARGPVDTVRTIGPDNNQWTTETGPGLPGAAVFRMAFDTVVAGRMWAATTKGLFRRGAAGAWAKVEASKVRQCTDVVVVPVVAEPKEPDDQLIFAAFKDGTLVWSHTGDADTWTPIALGDYAKKVRPKNGIGRMVIAVARKGIPNPVLYVLSEGPRLWRVEGVAADLVFGVPSDLLGDQGEYDMAIAAHPALGAAADDQLALGGSSVKHDGFNDAALYQGAVHHGADGKFRFVPSTHVTAPKTSGWVGQSMHPDVHAIGWVTGPSSADPTVMWI